MENLDLFREVTVRVCGTLYLAQAFENVFELLKPLLPIDELRINILDTDLHAVKTILIVDDKKTENLLFNPLVLPLPRDVENELKGNGLEDIRIVGKIEDDRASSAIKSDYFSDVPDSSMLIMRLLMENQRQGVLLLRAEGENRYSAGDKQLLAQLNEPLAIALNNSLAHYKIEQLKNTLAEENRYLHDELHSGGQEIIGASFGLASVIQLLRNVAPLDSTVLILGETGVGKELFATAVHNASSRKSGPFVKVNCGAIPDTLIDSELFGHEKGAFTGAITQKRGRFERANGGTLFLDEIAELPLEAQVRLLRVLQTNEFERVGGDKAIETDVRIIAATHRNLEKMVAEGRFRHDLWYRINIFPIHIPPLRDRSTDIPALVHHFIEKKSIEMGLYPRPQLSDEAMNILKTHTWPGNVRELENAVEREIILRRGSTLRFSWLEEDTSRQKEIPAEIGSQDNNGTGKGASHPVRPATLDAVIKAHIREVLAYTNGKVGGQDGAAALLGMNSSTLRHKMRKMGIPYGRQQQG